MAAIDVIRPTRKKRKKEEPKKKGGLKLVGGNVTTNTRTGEKTTVSQEDVAKSFAEPRFKKESKRRKRKEDDSRLQTDAPEEDLRQQSIEQDRQEQDQQLSLDSEDSVIRLGGDPAPSGRSFSEQLEKAKNLPLGHPGSLKTTEFLAKTLAYLSVGKFIFAGGGTAATTSAGGKAGNVVKVAGKFKSNPKTKEKTASFLAKIFTKTTTSTTTQVATGIGESVSTTVTATSGLGAGAVVGLAAAAAGGTLTIIGTYPFAGFIKEEALQQVSLAYNVAIESGDFEGADRALAEQQDILNVTAWEQILNAVPFVNVQKQLLDFYKAARVNMKNQATKLERARAGEPTLFEIQSIERKEREDIVDAEDAITEQEVRDENREKNRLLDEESKQRELDAFSASAAENRRLDLEAAIQESELFKSLSKGKTSSQKSTLTFGLIKTIEQILNEG